MEQFSSCASADRTAILLQHPERNMSGSVRVIARVRPLLKGEIEKDVIVEAAGDSADGKTIVRIPNPKKESESFSFQFNSVYPSGASQQTIFDNEGE